MTDQIRAWPPVHSDRIQHLVTLMTRDHINHPQQSVPIPFPKHGSQAPLCIISGPMVTYRSDPLLCLTPC